MLGYNEKNRSLALIIVRKVFNNLCNFLGTEKIIGEMLSTYLIAIEQVLWMYWYLSQNIF